ncbi:hypothetical protein BD289DRAFT_179150 [Coniella lustricola]|uniref:Uncharacterized protein n=1 Tax=Coniella lustricola TaxID=2025994 RepID=A0A2T3ADQ7_9PEZI|nr:hypothetical protein BD289DRAFT_179150 [Coniella lustricola]
MWPNTIHISPDDPQQFGNLYQEIVPWFSYRVLLPARPLPSIAQRPEIKTERLIIRHIVPRDLEDYFALRSDANTQQHCKPVHFFSSYKLPKFRRLVPDLYIYEKQRASFYIRE